jgi:sialic acid synthase SpsE
MKIGETQIDAGVYVIAEIGVNHDGSAERAVGLADAAADAGADAVKLQFFETDRLLSRAAKLAAYQRTAGETDPVAMLRRLELTIDGMARVVERAHARGVHAIVTVFSAELVDEADTLAWDAYKTASPDLVHVPLLRRLVATGRPLIVSTGAADAGEVRGAFAGELRAAAGRAAVLQCVSSYPTGDEDFAASLPAIAAMRTELGVPAGLSDHTPRVDAGAVAVSRGAAVLEKHLTYSKRAPGPDHAASLEPAEFAAYVAAARAAAARRNESSTDVPRLDDAKRVLACESDVRTVSRQSIVARRAIRAGERLDAADLTLKRPGTGLLGVRWDGVVGRTAARDIDPDVPIVAADVAGLSA